mmetsp:Transcript_22180/g.33778  ORF Transcript_22180/g.33778 Transcript_22180/m.33778 type:complete len:520 (+) Transcript_22180:307-1866(+)
MKKYQQNITLGLSTVLVCIHTTATLGFGYITPNRHALSKCLQNRIDEETDDIQPDENASGSRDGKGRAKYELSPNTTWGDVEEDGLYWNAASPVSKFQTEHMPLPEIEGNGSRSSAEIDIESAERDSLSSTKADPPLSASSSNIKYDLGLGKNTPIEYLRKTKENDTKQWLTNTKEGQFLSRACVVYDGTSNTDVDDSSSEKSSDPDDSNIEAPLIDTTTIDGTADLLSYENIDQSIPLSVYDPDNGIDLVWSLLRTEAKIEAQREPLLVSFLYSTILNHQTLESALAFHLANRLASASMDSIQVMNIILEALTKSPSFRRDLRADMIAVRDRDPACAALPDVFLHFKGFHALQAYRVANFLWHHEGRKTLAHYFQSQMSQCFQIDIHPKATLKSGIMIDHGTGVVIGETAVVGNNCSILHHVTLGGSGKRGVDRHPKIGDGALLGTGATILGNIKVGKGCQVGAGTLVIDDLPDHSVAVGVPAKIIGTYKEQESQPSRTMNQVGSKESDMTITYDSMI